MTAKSKLVAALLEAVSGRSRPDYVGTRVWSRDGRACGVVTGTSLCRLESCGGARLHVRWPDGHRTYPCARGCSVRADGDLQIE